MIVPCAQAVTGFSAAKTKNKTANKGHFVEVFIVSFATEIFPTFATVNEAFLTWEPNGSTRIELFPQGMRSNSNLLSSRPSILAERDPRLPKIVGRHLHLDLVADVDTNPVLAHLAGDVGEDFVSVRQGNFEHRARQDLSYRAGQFNGFFFSHTKN